MVSETISTLNQPSTLCSNITPRFGTTRGSCLARVRNLFSDEINEASVSANTSITASDDLKLKVIGLMCMPPIDQQPKPHFLMLRKMALDNNLLNLSMGMSKDYKIALSCGATHIRLGTCLFGERF